MVRNLRGGICMNGVVRCTCETKTLRLPNNNNNNKCRSVDVDCMLRSGNQVLDMV